MTVQKARPAAADAPQPAEDESAGTVPQRHRILHNIYWTPPWCRWDVDNPPPFTIWLNVLYACAGGFTAANLYYNHPILNILADEFNTSEAGVSSIPTLAQAGDATGLLFILPLADFFPRRKFTLTLVACAATFWIGLCVTNHLTIFLVLTYLSALFTGATQIMLPLVAELSPPETRAFNISIVGAGPTLGILLARILSGIVTNYTSWRNVYWLALGLQGCVLIALWLFMPDYPATNSLPVRKIVKTYPQIIWSIITLYPKHAVLVQAALLSFCTFFALTSYWTTLTFLLAGPPYHYNSVDIGLFGLVGLATMLLGPIYGKYVIQPLQEPLFSVIVGKTVSLVGIVVGTYTGTHNVAGPIIQAFMLDAGLMIVQIANRMAIHGVEPQGRNRVNTAFVSVMYLGQLTGTKTGNEVYEKHGGWIASGSLSVAVIAFSYVIIALRGPYEPGWIGWGGGWRLKPKEKKGDQEEAGCAANASEEMKDIQEREKTSREYDGVDNRRSQTAKDDDKVDGEKGNASSPESLYFGHTPSDLTDTAAQDGTVDLSLLVLPTASGTLQSINEGHLGAKSGEDSEVEVTSRSEKNYKGVKGVSAST